MASEAISAKQVQPCTHLHGDRLRSLWTSAPRSHALAGAAAAGSDIPQLIDHRGVSKVPTFSGRRADFEEWIFPFESYTGLLGWETLMDRTRHERDEIYFLNLSDEAERVGRSLYHLLVSTTKGTALSIVRLTERGNGFEALRKLYLEYRPRLNEEHGSMLQMVLAPTWWKDREGKQSLTETLIAWDELIARYEQATCEKVTGNMKTSTIMAHAPQEIKNLLRSAPAEVRADHGKMRATIFEAVVGRKRASCALPAMNDGPRPMEVDAISGDKSFGKGKKGSADGCRICGKLGHQAKECYYRDDAKGKGKGKQVNTEKIAGKCNYCQKTCHKQSECRTKEYDEKNGKGGGKKGTNAISAEKAAGSFEAITWDEVYAEEEEDDFFCMAMSCQEGGHQETCTVEDTAFITMDTASDCHCAPTDFGEGCSLKEDAGPRVRDTQCQRIKLDAVATVPMSEYMALPRFPPKLFPKFPPGSCFHWFPGGGLNEISLNLVCWVKTANKITGKIALEDAGVLDFYWVLGFSLIGSLSGLRRVVRVGDVCLFPGPAQLVAHLLPEEVVLT
jgi:hypothetical protein